jgi:hypothetical protein
MQIKPSVGQSTSQGASNYRPGADPCATGRINRVKDKQGPSYGRCWRNIAVTLINLKSAAWCGFSDRFNPAKSFILTRFSRKARLGLPGFPALGIL